MFYANFLFFGIMEQVPSQRSDLSRPEENGRGALMRQEGGMPGIRL
jgi:hypothetical protein